LGVSGLWGMGYTVKGSYLRFKAILWFWGIFMPFSDKKGNIDGLTDL